MRHLLSYSVYQDPSVFGPDPAGFLSSLGCDGLELLTAYDVPCSGLEAVSPAVHLPYAPDWLAAWEDRPEDLPEQYSLYFMYGRSRKDLMTNLRRAVDAASVLEPAYGVLHAGNADTSEIFHRSYSRNDRYVLGEFCEMVNTLVSEMPGGEPPFPLLYENLWWPGLRLTDDSGFKFIRDHMEFDRWGICLDTGHLMSCLPTTSEEDGIERLLSVFDGYCDELIERIMDVHLHWSATYGYRSTFEERDRDCPVEDFLKDANSHVMNIDTHTPFSSPRCREILDVLRPDFVAHEVPGTECGMIEDFIKQRSLLERCHPALLSNLPA